MTLRSFCLNYLGTIWTLLAFGTLLWLVGESSRLAEVRSNLEVSLQDSIDSAQERLTDNQANWDERVTNAKTSVSNNQASVDEFSTPENPEPSGYYYDRAVRALETAQSYLKDQEAERTESIKQSTGDVEDAKNEKTARLLKFDQEEALQVVDWAFVAIGLLIGIGLLGATRMMPANGTSSGGSTSSRPPVPAGRSTDPGIDDDELDLVPDD
jgi:hypothetical protein